MFERLAKHVTQIQERNAKHHGTMLAFNPNLCIYTFEVTQHKLMKLSSQEILVSFDINWKQIIIRNVIVKPFGWCESQEHKWCFIW